MQGADGDHRGVQRIHIARDDGLKRHHDRRGGHQRICRTVRHGPMPPRAVHAYRGVITRRHRRPITKHQLPRGCAWHVVHGKDGITRVLFKQTVGHHAHRTAPALFCGLKNQIQGAVKRHLLRDGFGRCQQHGRVAIVAAGMHHTGCHAAPWHACRLVNGQGIHVGTQA